MTSCDRDQPNVPPSANLYFTCGPASGPATCVRSCVVVAIDIIAAVVAAAAECCHDRQTITIPAIIVTQRPRQIALSLSRSTAPSVIWSAFTVPYQTVHASTLTRPRPFAARPAGKGRRTHPHAIFMDGVLMASFDFDQCPRAPVITVHFLHRSSPSSLQKRCDDNNCMLNR